jgi:class 3 adenylate cyclase/tetratricopeptide (TPR) repeat protein
MEAAVMFADISGFMGLTRELARQGPEGAERLSTILGGYLGRLQELIAAHGGDVVTYAGDALLGCWPDHDRDYGARLAAQCALTVGEELNGFQATADVRLSIKCSVGAGPLSALDLGGLGGGWVALVDGAAVRQLAPCNAAARAGEVVVSPEAAGALGPVARLRRRSGAIRLLAVREAIEPEPLRATALTPEAAAAARGYVLPPVAERIEAGQLEWLSEFRVVTTVFVGLGDVDYRRPDAADRLQQLVVRVQRVLERYAGLLVSMQADDKGTFLLVAFGLPNWRHEDDPERAVLAALGVREALTAIGLPGSIGVTTGLVYAGEVAAGERRFYTLIGAPINLAARLMQAASGDILCDGETAHRAGRHARLEPLEPIALKGVSEPVAVHRPLPSGAAAGAGGGRAIPLIGRRRELAVLERAVATAQAGQQMTVLLEGEPGIGKSRLVDHMSERARGEGMRVLAAIADPIDRTVPYLAWRDVVLELLDWRAAANWGTGAQREHVEELVRAAGVAELAPLLGVVLPLELPDNDTTRGLSGDARAERTREVLTRLIAHAARGRSTLVTIEDAHWLDGPSWALAVQLSERVAPLALVLASRPPDAPMPPPYARLEAGELTTKVVVDQLPAEEALQLVRARLGVEQLPESIEAFLRERAGGHPLYAQELGYALQEAGALIVEDGRAALGPAGADVEGLRVPDTIEGLVTSRIDRLSAREQLSLKVAAVIGRVFPYRVLHDVHPVPADRPLLPEQLEHFDRLALAHPEAPGVEATYAFHHAILRDVAYDLLTYTQRRRMHRAIGEWYERHVTPEQQQHGLLAHHWSRAVHESDPPALVSKAAAHLHRAAEQALASSAHAEAAEHLVRAEPAISWLAPGPERDALELQSRSLLGYALMNVRGYGDPEVERAYRRARQLSAHAPRSRELGPALYGLFSFYASRAQYDPASEVARELIELGEQLDDPAARLVGDNSLGLSSILRGELEWGAGFCERSHRAADREPAVGVLPQYGGDFRGYPRAWLSIAQCLLGRPDDAERTFEEALELTRWHPYTHGFVLCFAGLPHLRRDADAVRRHAGNLAALAGRYGFMMLGAIANVFLGWADAVDGGSNAAVEQMEEGIAVPRFVALESFMPWYMAMLAEARAATGQPEEARAAVDEGLAFVRRAGGSFYEPELHRLAAELADAAGADPTEVEGHLDAARRLARVQGARWWELRIATDRCRRASATPAAIEELSAARAAVIGGAGTPVVEAADTALVGAA